MRLDALAREMLDFVQTLVYVSPTVARKTVNLNYDSMEPRRKMPGGVHPDVRAGLRGSSVHSLPWVSHASLAV